MLAYPGCPGRRLLSECMYTDKKILVGPKQFLGSTPLALSVIATATWLGGWLSHSGIVSKRLNLSENFCDHLKAPSF